MEVAPIAVPIDRFVEGTPRGGDLLVKFDEPIGDRRDVSPEALHHSAAVLAGVAADQHCVSRLLIAKHTCERATQHVDALAPLQSPDEDDSPLRNVSRRLPRTSAPHGLDIHGARDHLDPLAVEPPVPCHAFRDRLGRREDGAASTCLFALEPPYELRPAPGPARVEIVQKVGGRRESRYEWCPAKTGEPPRWSFPLGRLDDVGFEAASRSRDLARGEQALGAPAREPAGVEAPNGNPTLLRGARSAACDHDGDVVLAPRELSGYRRRVRRNPTEPIGRRVLR